MPQDATAARYPANSRVRRFANLVGPVIPGLDNIATRPPASAREHLAAIIAVALLAAPFIASGWLRAHTARNLLRGYALVGLGLRREEMKTREQALLASPSTHTSVLLFLALVLAASGLVIAVCGSALDLYQELAVLTVVLALDVVTAGACAIALWENPAADEARPEQRAAHRRRAAEPTG